MTRSRADRILKRRYGHRGDFRMLDEIIAAHGGEARFARDAYVALDPVKRDSVVAFLRSQIIEAP